jgi:hypothetical protein
MTDNNSQDEPTNPGDEWPNYYRGYSLSVNADGEVWWQAYNGTDRLKLDPTPGGIVEDLLQLKRQGGRVRITESGTVLTRSEVEGDDDDYESLYIGEADVKGELVPPDDPSHAVPVAPTDLNPGELWSSVYDGAKYSFVGDRFWWHNPQTKRRHPFAAPLPSDIVEELRQLRPNGGSFRITPLGDVLTQIPTNRSPSDVREQFRALPRPVKRVLQLRRNRGNVDMIPVYVGTLDTDSRPIAVTEPTRLTDPLTEEEKRSLEGWAAADSQETMELSPDNHRVDSDDI